MAILFKVIYRFNIVSIKNTIILFQNWQTDSETKMSTQEAKNFQHNLKKKLEGLHSDFQMYYKVLVIKIIIVLA